MKLTRASGILLHPTSLPGPYGIGELGPEAVRFLAFLSESGQTLWQVLPLHPTGHGNSPYQSPSAFAGNPLLISLDRLVDAGLLTRQALHDLPNFPAGRVDFEAVTPLKLGLLRKAHERFKPGAEYEEFCDRHSHWLDDYSLFAALSEQQPDLEWSDWDEDLVTRRPPALRAARKALASELRYHQFLQYVFFTQLGDVKLEANRRGIRIIGDMPIFVARHSSDVWAHQELFHLDERGKPTVVAGVPPDYFSATGQLWGNPLYDWEAMDRENYAWWVERLRMACTLYDLVRIDHFRGFESYWEIQAGEETAIGGRWVQGPGAELFEVLEERLGDLPIIAEDLGIITKEVEALRDQLGLPGMKVLQFAFNGPTNPYLPHNHVPNSVVYTGTHDNDTTRGWWEHAATRQEKAFARRYLHARLADVSWDLIRVAFNSVADLAVVPLQDVLDLGTEARMNVPGEESGNWAWRLTPGSLTAELESRLKGLSVLYERIAEDESEDETPEAE